MLAKQADGHSIFYVDYSTLSQFAACREFSRLSTKENLTSQREYYPFTFGGAFHHALNTLNVDNDLEKAQLAFVEYLKDENSTLPINIEADRRSVERGLNLINAYRERWMYEPYEVVRFPDGRPYSELGFRINLGSVPSHLVTEEIPIFLCGTVDKLVRHKEAGTYHGFETKTTTQGLSQFIKHVKPNMQINIYDYALYEMYGFDIKDFIWDCIFISDRQPKAKGTAWEQLGIDIEKDFARQTTTRSVVDRKEFLFDLKHKVLEYIEWYFSSEPRWPRDGAFNGKCHMFGGCMYLDICQSNLNPMIISGLYTKKEWKPWEEKKTTYIVEKRLTL